MFRRALWGALAVILIVAVAGYFTRSSWIPNARARLLTWLGAPNEEKKEAAEADDHGHDHAGHDHAGHSDADSLELSAQAQKNIKLEVGKIELSTFSRSIAIPGMIVERPGKSSVAITAPLTGIVTTIYPSQGETVRPGQKLFDLRLTHEELVQNQGDFLRVAEELDVINSEISRLEKIAAEGGIPGRQVLERQYERQNKEAVLRAQYQALLLHGLSDAQVKTIQQTRTLLRELTVYVPEDTAGANQSQQPSDKLYEIKELLVTKGQSIAAGETLILLAEHSELCIEGNAFDKDIDGVNKAVEADWPITALLEREGSTPEKIENLKVIYVAGRVDPESRTFHFYISLPNKLIRDGEHEGRRFISWRFKPGQRVQLSVPVEQWKERIVLPVDAVAQDGVETYIFVPNGKHFDRRAVHVEYRDRFSVVIANDGSVFPGDMVAVSGAQQMQLALKNKTGGGIDPHAGHNH